MSFFKVSGYKPMRGQTYDYFIADTEAQVLAAVKQQPVEEGGFVNYSVEEIEKLPIELNIICPNCEHEFISPDRVEDLCS